MHTIQHYYKIAQMWKLQYSETLVMKMYTNAKVSEKIWANWMWQKSDLQNLEIISWGSFLKTNLVNF